MAPKKKVKKNLSAPIASDIFYNRDVSWQQFNYRVLNEALDERTPLLERLRFIDIYRSNSDEFFMKRIGPLLMKMRSGVHEVNHNLAIQDLYKKLVKTSESNWKKIETCFEESIYPALLSEGISIERYEDLSPSEKRQLNTYFKANIFPILTPLAVDSGHPFPFLSNLSKSIGVCLNPPRRKKEKIFARVKIPTEFDQWIPLRPNKKYNYRFISLEDLIINNLSSLFPGMKIQSTMIFRVTRNAALSEDGDEPEDLLEMVEEGLKERKFAPIVRFEYLDNSDLWNLSFLMDELNLPTYATSPIFSFLRYTNFSKIIDTPIKSLKYPSFKPKHLTQFENLGEGEHQIFNYLKKRDILVHFPFESFKSSIELFLKTASNDPKVMAIKMTLYRTDTDGKLIEMLINAAENKKQVAVIIELKARFDEESNIKWAQKLEDAGIHVSYGLTHLKTHAKLIMVVRKEKDGVRTYVNIGTGNFNSQTSKLYTDLSFFTSKKMISNDAISVFNYLTGSSVGGKYENLLVAPFNMFTEFQKLIHNEIQHAKKGRPAHIICKMNSLEDPRTIKELYRASQAGVQIQLIVRGFCCLKAGVKGLSENIRVYSLVGRLLEHSRLYYFSDGKTDPLSGKFYIGSADWMSRNLFERVEVIAPITTKDLRKKLWEIFQYNLADNRHLWELRPNGQYKQRNERKASKIFNAQLNLLKRS
ncbi:MAG: polyphosphate kinase 1 [Bacteriovoracaceae bacterium]